jgi:hypothetical protein
MAPATSATSSNSDVADQLAVLRAVGADVDDGRAGGHHVGGDQPRPADGRDHDVGLPAHGGEVAGPGVGEGDGRVAALQRQHHGERPADEVRAAHDHDVRAGRLDPGLVEDLEDPVGGAGEEGRLAHRETTGRVGVQRVDVLGGQDQLLHRRGVEVLGQRQLDEDPVDLLVLVELADDAARAPPGVVSSSSSIWRLTMPGRLAGPVLHADVDLARRVAAHQHGGQAGGDPVLGLQAGDVVGDAGTDLGRQGLAVEDACGHVRLLASRVSGRGRRRVSGGSGGAR